jgi:hypothetical protein
LGFSGAYASELAGCVEFFVCVHLFLEGRKYYKFVRVVELALVYEYQFKIMDLMLNLLIIAHFLVLALLSSPCCSSWPPRATKPSTGSSPWASRRNTTPLNTCTPSTSAAPPS